MQKPLWKYAWTSCIKAVSGHRYPCPPKKQKTSFESWKVIWAKRGVINQVMMMMMMMKFARCWLLCFCFIADIQTHNYVVFEHCISFDNFDRTMNVFAWNRTVKWWTHYCYWQKNPQLGRFLNLKILSASLAYWH